MRHVPTQPERILWSLLRKSQLGGLKFRRQAVIGPYIVDFCCPLQHLVVEVDGVSHVGRASADTQRTRLIESCGYRVLRFTNDDVIANLEGVGLAILRAAGVDVGAPMAAAALDPPPCPLPFREGESTS
jgi:very-short-patch-repair endonuclease